MIRVFYGDDRTKASTEAHRLLGPNYEVLDGPDIAVEDLPSIFLGTSLLSSERSILIRDFTANHAIYEKLPDYLRTPHNVILLESKLDKRSATYKLLKDQLEFREFSAPKSANFGLVFDIYHTAKKDGPQAVAMLESIKSTEDSIKFTGLLAHQAIKDFAAHQGTKEKRALTALSQLDIATKSTPIDPWLLIESFLLQVPSL